MAIIGEESVEETKLFLFPRRVNLIARSKGYSTSDINKMVIFFGLLAVFILGLIGRSFFVDIGYSLYIYWTLFILLVMFGLSFYLRYYVIKEPIKKREMEEESSDAFNRYCKVRSLDPIKELNRYKREISIFQYATGGVYTMIRLTHGGNSDKRARGNNFMLSNFYRYLASNSIDVDNYIDDEDFSDSPEAKHHLKTIAECDNEVLANTMARITRSLYDITEEESNVECLYILLRARSEGFNEVLENCVNYLFELKGEYSNSFRNIECLNADQYIRYVKNFHNLEGIDTTRIRIENFNENNVSLSGVRIYKIEYEDGSVDINSNIINSQVNKVRKVN